MKIDSVFGLVGNTPTVFLEKYQGAEIWLKLEGTNLTGSLKDRTAKRLVDEMEKRGTLTPGKKIIAPSSGSFAVALAMQAKLRGYKAVAVVNEKISGGNLKLLELLDAEIIRHGKITRDCVAYCENLMKERPSEYAYADQMNDPMAPMAHYDTTALEILRDIPELTTVIASMGSGSALLGMSRYFNDNNRSDIKLIASVAIPGDRKKITGTYTRGVDYVSPFIKEIEEKKILFAEMPVSFDSSKENAKVLATKGFFVGQQTGGLYDAAKQAVDKFKLTGPIVLLSGDTGLKWLPPDWGSFRLLRTKNRVVNLFNSFRKV